ncbi:hypothetical protein ACFPRL_31330 [Pseudoclavibacter helvolus]
MINHVGYFLVCWCRQSNESAVSQTARNLKAGPRPVSQDPAPSVRRALLSAAARSTARRAASRRAQSSRSRRRSGCRCTCRGRYHIRSPCGPR